MKCDELKQYEVFVSNPYNNGGSFREIAVLPADKVDEAIAELKQKLQDQCVSCPVKMQEDDVFSELKAGYTKLKEVNTQLKAKLEQEQSLRSHWNEDDYAMVNEIERLLNENEKLKQKLDEKESWVKMLGEGEAALSLELEKTKQKLHDAEMRADLAEAANTEYRIDLKNIKDNIAKHARNQYHKHNRQTLRALWLARALRAEERKYKYETWERHEKRRVYKDYDTIAIVGHKARTWSKVEHKCLKKAEEYK